MDSRNLIKSYLTNLIRSHSRIGDILSSCSNIINSHYFAQQRVIDTRYFEHLVKHIEALFKNLPIFVQSFPSLIEDEVKNKIAGYFRKITDSEFIA